MERWERPRINPLPANMAEQFHPIESIGSLVRDPESGRVAFGSGWRFDESVGKPWPPNEYVEMRLQMQQLMSLSTRVGIDLRTEM